MLPAEDRRHLPLYGSTLSPAKTTAAAPMASASRISVPALPGSDRFGRDRDQRGHPASDLGQAGSRQPAHRDQAGRCHGLGQRFRARSVTGCHGQAVEQAA